MKRREARFFIELQQFWVLVRDFRPPVRSPREFSTDSAEKLVKNLVKSKPKPKSELAGPASALPVESWPIDRPIAYARNVRKISEGYR